MLANKWDEIFTAVEEKYTPFNDFVLLHYRRQQMATIKEFMHTVYLETMKVITNKDLKYVGYRTLRPEERVRQILNPSIKGLRNKFDIQRNEVEHVKYVFKYKEEEMAIYLQLPYLVNDALIIQDTQYYLQLAFIEKLIYRFTGGIITKVMRGPIKFWRTELLTYTSASGKVYYDDIVTTRIHNKANRTKKKELKTALILYFLASRGLVETLKTFDINPDDAYFITETQYDEEMAYVNSLNIPVCDFEYFKLRMFSQPKLVFKVANSVIGDPNQRRVIASILYILQFFSRYSLNMLYDPTCEFFKIILGKCIHNPTVVEAMSHSRGVQHLDSVATYLDPRTKSQLHSMGIKADDIYDLLAYIFSYINKVIVNHSPNNLFDKKIGVLELIMGGTVQNAFIQFYKFNLERQVDARIVNRLMKANSKQSLSMSGVAALTTATNYNGNLLISILGKKIRQVANQNSGNNRERVSPTSREHKFHSSFPIVESIQAIPHSNPGNGGYANPYMIINPIDGSILVPPWIDTIEDQLGGWLGKLGSE